MSSLEVPEQPSVQDLGDSTATATICNNCIKGEGDAI